MKSTFIIYLQRKQILSKTAHFNLHEIYKLYKQYHEQVKIWAVF